MAIIKTESDFVVNAVSTSNAYGLMQIMEATYSDIRKKMPTDEKFSNILAEPKFAIQCGMCYLQWLNTPSLKLGGSRINIAAAYNGGCGNVRKWLETDGCARRGVLIADRIPREETRNYVKKVEENYKYYREYLGAIFADI
jgi:soluble lytic murein transglycosylase